MQNISLFTVKSLRTCEPGELIMMANFDGFAPDFAMVVSQGERTLVGVLRPGDPASSPKFIRTLEEETCVSYGKGWLFEVDQPSFLNSDLKHQPGSVCIRPEGPCIYLTAATGDTESPRGYLNLATCTMDRSSESTLYFDKWKVWASSAERDRQGSTPLFSSVKLKGAPAA